MTSTTVEKLPVENRDSLFSDADPQPDYYPPDILRQLEAEQLAFQKNEQLLYQQAAELGFEESGIREQLNKLSEGFEVLVRRYKNKVKLIITETLASGMIFGAAVGIETTTAHAQAPERPRYALKIPERQPYPVLTQIEVRKQLLDDNNERVFLQTNLDDPQTLFEFSKGQSGFVRLENDYFDKFLESRQKKITSLEVDHTHPKGSYVTLFESLDYSPMQIDQYVRGEKPWPPMPPSTPDFISQFKFQEHYRDEQISVKGRVLEPTGMWLYEVDPDSKYMKSILKLREAYYDRLNKILNEKEWDVMQSTVLAGAQDPRGITDYLNNPTAKEDPTGNMRSLGRKLARIDEEINKEFGHVNVITIALNNAGLKVVAAKDTERTQAIQDYINLCAKHGIHLKRISQ